MHVFKPGENAFVALTVLCRGRSRFPRVGWSQEQDAVTARYSSLQYGYWCGENVSDCADTVLPHPRTGAATVSWVSLKIKAVVLWENMWLVVSIHSVITRSSESPEVKRHSAVG